MNPSVQSNPIALCQCGCGKLAAIARKTDRSRNRNRIAGQPQRYARGHYDRPRHQQVDAVPFKIDGVYCRLIPLSKGLHAIVDASDYAWLMQHRWNATRKANSFYANSHGAPMHRVILGLGKGQTLKRGPPQPLRPGQSAQEPEARQQCTEPLQSI
jgi:hypothetical protein